MLRLFLGAVLIGFAPILVKLVAIGPTTTAFYRCAFAFLILMLLMASGLLSKNVRLSPRHWPREAKWLAALAGLLFAGDLYVWHRAVLYAGAGMGTILGNTQVFYSSLLGLLFFDERLTFRFVVSVLMAFAGVFLLVRFGSAPSSTLGDKYWWGVAFGLSTGAFYASYILTMRRLEKLSVGIPTEQLIAAVSAVAAIVLLPISLHESTLRLPVGMEWVWLPTLALVAQIAGWILITKNLPKVPLSRAGLIILAQPVVATVVGNLLFGESLSPLQLLGAVLTLAAIYLGTLPTAKLLLADAD
jgi:drug/metabolite transporter (DMT)-like permease